MEIDHEGAKVANDLNRVDEESDQDDGNEENDQEFQAIYKRVIAKYDVANGLKSIIKTTKTKTTTTTTSSSSSYSSSLSSSSSQASAGPKNVANIHNDESNNLKSVSQTLRYFYKLLKFYKLEHYMNDLIDSGYYTPISLHKLKQIDLDKLNVSPYDKKKFTKLQLFIKQVMNTISTSSPSSSNTGTTIATMATMATTNKIKMNAGQRTTSNGGIGFLTNGHSIMTNNNNNNNNHDQIEDEDDHDQDDGGRGGNNNANFEENDEKSSTNEILNNNKLIENFYQWQSLAIKRPISTDSMNGNNNLQNKNPINNSHSIHHDAFSSSSSMTTNRNDHHRYHHHQHHTHLANSNNNLKNSVVSSTSSSSLSNSSPSRSPSSLSFDKKTQLNTLKNSAKEDTKNAAAKELFASAMSENESFYRRMSTMEAYNDLNKMSLADAESKRASIGSRTSKDMSMSGKSSAVNRIASTGTNIYALNSARTTSKPVQSATIVNPVNRIKQRNMRASVNANASSRNPKSGGAVTPRSARAKSSDPSSLAGFRRASSLSNQNRLEQVPTPNEAPTDQIGAAVRHPTQPNFQRTSAKFFGPKLLANSRPEEISNVQFIENSNYNYGVPASQLLAQKNKNLRSKSANRRSSTFATTNAGAESGAGPSQPPIATADIFVYARKRPMLMSESHFTDAVVVENSDAEAQLMSTSICINEMKNTVDGTPILRKVSDHHLTT